jgi:hypothetical protein
MNPVNNLSDLLAKALYELSCIEELSIQRTDSINLQISEIFQHSQRALNALNDLKMKAAL